MVKPPRAHHFIPKFMLAGFTKEGTDRGKLWAFDLHCGEWRKSNPRQAGHQRDFHRVDLPGRDPFAVETFLAEQIEGPASLVIRRIVADEALPPPRSLDMAKLLGFVAVLVARVPNRRAEIDGLLTGIADLMRGAAGNPGRAVDLFPSSDLALLQNVKAYVDGSAPTVENPRTSHVQLMLDAAKAINECLLFRHWSLLKAADGEPDFVISDDPVRVRSTRPGGGAGGFALRDTVVTVPLTRRLALHGAWEGADGEVWIGNRLGIGTVNTCTVSASARWIWAPEKRVVAVAEDGEEADEQALFKAYQESLGRRGTRARRPSRAL